MDTVFAKAGSRGSWEDITGKEKKDILYPIVYKQSKIFSSKGALKVEKQLFWLA